MQKCYFQQKTLIELDNCRWRNSSHRMNAWINGPWLESQTLSSIVICLRIQIKQYAHIPMYSLFVYMLLSFAMSVCVSLSFSCNSHFLQYTFSFKKSHLTRYKAAKRMKIPKIIHLLVIITMNFSICLKQKERMMCEVGSKTGFR